MIPRVKSVVSTQESSYRVTPTIRPRRKRGWLFALALLGAASLTLASTACSSSSGGAAKSAESSTTFVFKPRVGLVYRHEMKTSEEVTIPGSNFRDAGEWRVLWEVTVEDAGGSYRYRRRLVELAITLNGEQILKGKEVEPRRAEIIQHMSKEGRVLDVTGTEQLTETLTSLVPEGARDAVRKEFSPANLKGILMARAVDAFDEIVGKPADVGQSWTTQGDFGPLRAKMVRVDSSVGCGGRTCRKLTRTFDVDQQKIGELARARVAGFLTTQGWDPSAVKVVDATVKVVDTFAVEPDTCHFHDALMTEEGKLTLEGPNGGRLELVLTSKHESHAEYPPPS
jgi:hypothetical protein